jgi:hypothetical protein
MFGISEPQIHAPTYPQSPKFKEIVILRAMDLFCLTVLRQLSLVDAPQFWDQFLNCRGSFDASKFWNALPEQFRLPVHSEPRARQN